MRSGKWFAQFEKLRRVRRMREDGRGGQAMNDNLKDNNIKSTELCERCVYYGGICGLKCFYGENCEMIENDSCKCVRVPLRTPCDYFVERDNY